MSTPPYSPPDGLAATAATDEATTVPPVPAPAESLAFCRAILPRVSRTFALSIRLLPGSLHDAVLAAYLLCRIADTIEDDHSATVERKSELLEMLVRALDEPAVGRQLEAATGELVAGERAHVELVGGTMRVLDVYGSLPGRSRLRVRHWVREMVRGMEKFVRLYPRGIRIRTLDEYKEYCYYVAGTVGHLLTDLWHEHAASIGVAEYRALWRKCRAFGEALQTVNILKDIAWDATHENAIYVPEQSLREHGSSHQLLLDPAHTAQNHAAVAELIELAWRDLDAALDYFTTLPRRALSVRAFCLLPLLFAYATLRELAHSRAMLRAGGTVKISRREVRALMVAGLMLVPSNAAVRWLVRRVRRKPFLAPQGARRQA
ncbi:MAG TPA: phytoene/squalene synthase family protein [Gemmatimonadaceae bacterium]|nr:phytoene/squalene synthase family protein [Gemmatimonadaceae bacterium]